MSTAARWTRHISSPLRWTAYFSLCLLPFCQAVDESKADSYSWIDKNGKVVYGTKAPKDARSVNVLKTRKLSRYSTDKALSRMQHSAAPTATTSQTPTVRDEPKDSELVFLPAELIASPATVTVNEALEVEQGSVQVKNANEFAVKDISVAMEFPDGALIPAIGPAELEAGAIAEFTLPKDFMPLKLDREKLKERQASSIKPIVIVHGFKR